MITKLSKNAWLPAARRAWTDDYGLAEDGAYLGDVPFQIGRGNDGSTGLDTWGSGPRLQGHILGGWVVWQTAGVPPHRDIAAFDERAAGYEQGWRGRLHYDIADRVAELAMSVHASPRSVLDVGCGTGYLLRLLAGRCPQATELAGTDPAPAMIEAAERAAGDRRLRFTVGAAEALPYPDDAFDLVVSATSFDHWADQRAGLGECARVLAPGGHLVLADLFSPLLLPTLLTGRRGKARTRQRASRLLRAAGFTSWPGTTSTPPSSRP